MQFQVLFIAMVKHINTLKIFTFWPDNQPRFHQSVSRTRVYTHHLRELTRGKLIVKKVDITLLEIIGGEGC
jgi:hypothetical protein